MDELTGLPTHLDLPEALAELRGDDPSAGLTAILFDVDGMIWVNDQRGHLEGDSVLARVGRWLESRARQVQGKAFRIAGDEFLLLLPGHSVDHALALAREVVFDCERLRIPYARRDDDRDFLALNAAVFAASAGFEHQIAQLRDAAAQAIYDAKLAQGQRFSVVATTEF
ncbi:MAG TPA: diguanylate cyclase [Thermoanaerobaculia bacterium]|jgi:diguanylate cyclase (GGDEF)-like protein|nr:diguanylate cyclase [Thermoanaerobaculia bacterium]